MVEKVDELKRAPSLGKINSIIFLVIGFLLFLLIVVILGLSMPYWVYGLAILVIVIASLLNYWSNNLDKIKSAGKGKAKTAIIGILIVGCLLALLYGLAIFNLAGLNFFGSADKIISAGGQSSLNLGNDSFGMIEIIFAKNPEEGDTIKLDIGLYKAGVNINTGTINPGKVCYLGSWSYNGDDAGLKEGEPWFDKDSRKTLRILNQIRYYRVILVGDSPIKKIDGDHSSVPLEGEKKISCGSCVFKEVRIYFSFFARIKALIGLG